MLVFFCLHLVPKFISQLKLLIVSLLITALRGAYNLVLTCELTAYGRLGCIVLVWDHLSNLC